MLRNCLIICLLFYLSACAPEEKVNYRLTSKQRQRVDTIVNKQVKLLRPYMDSLCDANFEAAVSSATDSIVQLRLEEETRLRSRIPINRNR